MQLFLITSAVYILLAYASFSIWPMVKAEKGTQLGRNWARVVCTTIGFKLTSIPTALTYGHDDKWVDTIIQTAIGMTAWGIIAFAVGWAWGKLRLERKETIAKDIFSTEKAAANWLGILGFLFFVGIILAYYAYSTHESKEQKRFMLACLSTHNDSFCERLWEKARVE